MTASKRPRKKYNTLKPLLDLANSQAKGSLMAMFHMLGENATAINVFGKPYNAYDTAHLSAVRNVFCMPRKWGLTIGTVCRTPLGNSYLSYDYTRLRTEHSLPDLDDFLEKEVSFQVGRVNREHLLTPFLIASPICQEFSEMEILALADKAKVFELHTPHEISELWQKGLMELAEFKCDELFAPAISSILIKNGFPTLKEVREKELGRVLALKGIGEKRLAVILKTIVDLSVEHGEERLKHYTQHEIAYTKFHEALEIMQDYRHAHSRLRPPLSALKKQEPQAQPQTPH